MDWFSGYGLILIILLLIPNILFALKQCAGGSAVQYHNPFVEILEQVGRFSSMVLMIFSIPLLKRGELFPGAVTIWISVSGALLISYYIVWLFYFKKPDRKKAMALAILPSVLFFLSGILRGELLLIFASSISAPCHILITHKNNQ